jgi:isoamylase
VLYELHVKGFTKLHPLVPENLRGTYAGLAHPAVIDHLKRMGVTSVELMPVHAFVDEGHLQRRGLTNYWGYSTVGYFAPHAEYGRNGGRNGEQVAEFKQLVRAFHEAGLEVLLDVVYNHTGEGSELGPTLSFRGIDNAGYYRLAKDRRYYADYTGTGNTLDATRPHVLALIMDSLRYWVEEMHVDGFRFDLAAALARGEVGYDRMSAFLDVVQQDPVVSRVKLIAEPWDVGTDGYRVGRFPPLWSEWNGKYRDAVRELLARRLGDAGRARHAPVGERGPLCLQRSTALRERELRDRPRRLHPARSRELRAKAQRGERRREPRRRERQPLVQLRRRGRDARTRG